MVESLSRRRFLAQSAGLAALPLSAGAGSSSEADVVVIGAGAAGLAATRALRERGVSTVTVEASGRIGGRAHTDTRMFGVPYDMGAHWLQLAGKNPFVRYAREHGFTVYPAPNEKTLYLPVAKYFYQNTRSPHRTRAIQAASPCGLSSPPVRLNHPSNRS